MQTPASLAAALDLLARGWTPFAGGTDLMVVFETGKLKPTRFINLANIAELSGIRLTDDAIELGALTTYTQLQRHEILQDEFPILCESSRETGAIAIQNRGTLGGNIANASPAADSAPGLVVYEAQVELVGKNGARWVPYDGFHTGYKTTVRQPDELIRAIRLPRHREERDHAWRKVGTRKAQAISKLAFAAVAGEAHFRIALGSVGPTVVRCRETEHAIEKAILGRAKLEQVIAEGRRALARDIAPIDDIRSTAEYRRHVAGNLLEAFLREMRRK
jgi:CO/xanthine dehydrogenase FAD-binding subunit